MSERKEYAQSESVTVNVSAQDLYDIVSDVTRTGEWSPVCTSCWWDEDATPGAVGAWFTGRNVTPDRTWETRSQVVTARPGQEFAWLVGGKFVRWGYSLTPVDGGTVLTESWEILDEGIAMFEERYGQEVETQLADRERLALSGIPQTLSTIKKIAESAESSW